MAIMRSANPTLNPKTFTGVRDIGAEPMTLQGTVNKTGALLLCLLVAAAWTWSQVSAGEEIGPWILIGALGGFVTALVTVFKKNWSPIRGRDAVTMHCQIQRLRPSARTLASCLNDRWRGKVRAYRLFVAC